MSKFESRQAAWEYYLNLDSHHSEEKQHNNIYTDAFEAGAEWEHKRLIEKVYKWIDSIDFDMRYWNPEDGVCVGNFIEDLRKIMEE